MLLIGIHSPEFFWEKSVGRVESATRELGIDYPVAIDNDCATWKRYGTRYSPTLHIIDKQVIVRYTGYGEGGYAKVESILRRLLNSGP